MNRLPRNERRRSPRAPRIVVSRSSRRPDFPGEDTTGTPPPVAVADRVEPPATVRVASAAAEEPLSTRAVEVYPSADPAPGERAAARVWTLLFAVAALLVVLVVRRTLAGEAALAVGTWRELLPFARSAVSAPDDLPSLEQALAPPAPRADARVRHDSYTSIRGGVLYAPRSFASEDGAYDLLLHFHGNVKVVVESAEVADLSAMVAVVNLGIGSAPYQDAYAVPGTYEALLDDIDRAVAARGLARPRLRRVALSAWSAGYGAISTILDQGHLDDPLDAVLVLDGIHCGFLDDAHEALNPLQLAPFARAARAAAEGGVLFSITHSAIDPRTYASSTATASYLLDDVKASRVPSDPSTQPPHLELVAARGAVAKKLEKSLLPTTEAHAGSLHVRGFRGETPQDHMAHLLQMGATVLPELATRWAPRPAARAVVGSPSRRAR